MGNSGPLLVKQPEETSQKRLVLEMNGYADIILKNAKNLDFNSSKNKGNPEYDAAQIRNYAGKLKDAVASTYGAAPASYPEKIRAITDNADKMLRNVPDDPATALLYAEKLQKAVSALKESEIPAVKNPAKKEEPKGKQLDLDQKLEFIPATTMGLGNHILSFSVDSKSDIRTKVKLTLEMGNKLYIGGIDIQARPDIGLMTPAQKYLITEKGKNLFEEGGKHKFTANQAILHKFGTDMAMFLKYEQVAEVSKWLGSLPEDQRVKALWDPSRATSDAANKIFEVLKNAGVPVTKAQADRDFWEVVAYAEAHQMDISKVKINEIKAKIAEERAALPKKDAPKPNALPQGPIRPGEMWQHPKELPEKIPAIQASDEGKKTEEKKNEPLGPVDMGWKQEKPAGWQEAVEAPAKAKKGGKKSGTGSRTKAKKELYNELLLGENAYEKETRDSRLLAVREKRMKQGFEIAQKELEKKGRVAQEQKATEKSKPAAKEIAQPNSEEAPKSIFASYAEFGGKEMKSGIGWVDGLWADQEFVKGFKSLSGDPEARKAAVENFIEYVKMSESNRSTYEGMEPHDADMLLKILKSFKE